MDELVGPLATGRRRVVAAVVAAVVGAGAVRTLLLAAGVLRATATSAPATLAGAVCGVALVATVTLVAYDD